MLKYLASGFELTTSCLRVSFQRPLLPPNVIFFCKQIENKRKGGQCWHIKTFLIDQTVFVEIFKNGGHFKFLKPGSHQSQVTATLAQG